MPFHGLSAWYMSWPTHDYVSGSSSIPAGIRWVQNTSWHSSWWGWWVQSASWHSSWWGNEDVLLPACTICTAVQLNLIMFGGTILIAQYWLHHFPFAGPAKVIPKPLPSGSEEIRTIAHITTIIPILIVPQRSHHGFQNHQHPYQLISAKIITILKIIASSIKCHHLCHHNGFVTASK